ncbi:Phospholipase D/Transphosphatidylase [uncultured Paludibacter sp.]|nr:Phospholipase D/Transphosphatidylase [uncultured Paludibacter sp.]
MKIDHIILLVFIVLYAYTIFSAISVILLENRNPSKSLSWVLVLIFLPFLGLIFYLVLGQDYRKRKMISQKSIHRIKERPVTSINLDELNKRHMDVPFLKLTKLLHKNNEAAGYAYNKINVYSDPEQIFGSMFDAIRNAKKHIHIEFFIIENDKISNQLRELLIEKAKQGVRVRVIYDYFGSYNLNRIYIHSMREAGIYIKPFLPFRLRWGRSKINFRNHRKLIIVDGEIGFTGGVNIADRYIYGDKLGKWRDTVVRIEGAGVHGIQQLFLIDWYFVEKKIITDAKYFPEPKAFDENLIQFVSSGPDTDWPAIMQGIASAIMTAKKYVYIHTPYFMPPELIEGSIQLAAMSGIEVILMIPNRSDAPLSDASSFSFLGSMLEAGVRVFRYMDGFLHSKAIVIDDFLSIIGSANMDERSFEQNFEANAFIYDKNTALQLKKLFLSDLTHCEELTLDDWNNRQRRQKLKESFARLFSPLM